MNAKKPTSRMYKPITDRIDIKPYLICLSIFIIIVGMCAVSIEVTQKSSDELLAMTDVIIEYVDNEKWDNATQAAEDLDQKWHKYKKTWSVLLDHKKVTVIDEQTVKIGEHLTTRNKSLAKCELSILSESLNHYPHEELPLIENIF